MVWRPSRIISGGQTGADRGGLDAAIALGLEHGGWCPRGRRAEDGKVPAQYDLVETESEDWGPRTIKNVVESDATVVFVGGDWVTTWSRVTLAIAKREGRPRLLVQHALAPAWSDKWDRAVREIRVFLGDRCPAVLNVAGSRERLAPGIQRAVRDLLVEALRDMGEA